MEPQLQLSEDKNNISIISHAQRVFFISLSDLGQKLAAIEQQLGKFATAPSSPPEDLNLMRD
jgi:hypothetical protein